MARKKNFQGSWSKLNEFLFSHNLEQMMTWVVLPRNKFIYSSNINSLPIQIRLNFCVQLIVFTESFFVVWDEGSKDEHRSAEKITQI